MMWISEVGVRWGSVVGRGEGGDLVEESRIVWGVSGKWGRRWVGSEGVEGRCGHRNGCWGLEGWRGCDVLLDLDGGVAGGIDSAVAPRISFCNSGHARRNWCTNPLQA